MFRILRETPADTPEVEYLYDLAFAPGRTALSSYRLRDGVDPVHHLSLTARDEYDTLAAAIGAKPPRHIPVWLGRVAARLMADRGAGDVMVMMMETARGASNDRDDDRARV